MPQLLTAGTLPAPVALPRSMPTVQRKALATVLLVLLSPVLLLAGLAVWIGSGGPVLMAQPFMLRSGLMMYRTEFRTLQCFDAETYEGLRQRPDCWMTPVGAALRALHLVRLPVLLDIRAGRFGFSDGFS